MQEKNGFEKDKKTKWKSVQQPWRSHCSETKQTPSKNNKKRTSNKEQLAAALG